MYYGGVLPTFTHSTAACPNGHLFLYQRELSYLLHPGFSVRCMCGRRNTIQDVAFHLSERAQAHVKTPRRYEWYHATRVPEWLSKVQESDVRVHVGVENAAWDIILTEADMGITEPFYLWTLRFTQNTIFTSTLVQDEDSDSIFPKNTASPYVNRWEDPGSVSYITPAKWLKAMTVRQVTVEEARARESLFNIFFSEDFQQGDLAGNLVTD